MREEDIGQAFACEDCGWAPQKRAFVQPSNAAGGRWVCKKCHFAAVDAAVKGGAR